MNLLNKKLTCLAPKNKQRKLYSLKRKVLNWPSVSTDVRQERVKRKHLSCEAGVPAIIRSEENFSKWQERKLGVIQRDLAALASRRRQIIPSNGTISCHPLFWLWNAAEAYNSSPFCYSLLGRKPLDRVITCFTLQCSLFLPTFHRSDGLLKGAVKWDTACLTRLFYLSLWPTGEKA